MAFKDCVESATYLADEDAEYVLAEYDRLRETEGIQGKDAIKSAIRAVIGDLKQERKETLFLIRSQHPDLPGKQPRDTLKAEEREDERLQGIPEPLGVPGEAALEGAPAEDVQRAEQQRPAGEPAAERPGEDTRRADVTGEREQDTVRPGVGTGEGAISIPATGDTQSRVKAQNYVITADENIGAGGQRTKYKDNIAAIRLLKSLEENNQQATSENQAVLVRYVGWGGIPQAFDPNNDKWSKEYAELKELLTEDEYNAARRSTQDAHYTAPAVIHGMYSAIDRLGFNKGRILEPAMGVGHFFGLMPADIRGKSHMAGIELDSVSGAIAKYLYPTANINAPMGFQEIELPNDYFDLAIGNPPFGSQKLYDKNHKNLKDFSIHNFFFAKSIEKLRPGGVLSMVVSNSMMDKVGGKQREWMAKRTKFLGAIRLPNNAFKQNALTEVTTDIIFLQKKGEGVSGEGPSWQSIGYVKDPDGGEDIPINEYYKSHPEMLLGKVTRQSTMYRAGQPALTMDYPENEFAGYLSRAIENLPEDVYQSAHRTVEDQQSREIEVENPEHVKVGGYTIGKDGGLAQRTHDIVGEAKFIPLPDDLPKIQVARIKGMIKVRDTLRRLMRSEIDTTVTDKTLQTYRAGLNRDYDSYTKKYGAMHSLGNSRVFKDDPDYSRLLALEWDYDPGITKARAQKEGIEQRKPSLTKADIFSKRVREPYRPVEKADNAQDALLISLSDLGVVDLKRMRDLTGMSDEQLTQDLAGQIFNDPESGWQTSDQYLSGNVKHKLAVARKAAEDNPDYLANVQALETVQPEDVEAIDISVRAGSPWVPASDVEQFVRDLLGSNTKAQANYQSVVGKWFVSATDADLVKNRTQWGTERISASKMLQSIFRQKSIKIYDRNFDGSSVINTDATMAANQKADEIRAEFEDWIWRDPERRTRLGRIYNDTYNTNRTRSYDGSHLKLPGITPLITLNKHQKNVAWRIIQEGGALLDHVVGSGKTFSIVASVMERKRMGLIKRPMIAVPNHLVGQWAAEFVKLYPGAKILAPTKQDFEAKNRKKLFAKMATGDWDAIIVAHSHFERIPMPHEEMVHFLEQQVTEIVTAIDAVKAEGGDRMSIKEMEKTKDRITARLEEAADLERDDVIDFAELGIDSLYVDEAHEYKNLFYTTSMNRVAGLGDTGGSKKAFDLFVKARAIQKMNNGTGMTFATGTPISNSMAEMYTMQRYMQYDDLHSRGLHNFDAWANTFGMAVTDWELDATGINYKLNTRFAKFVNVPELMTMYRGFADVITQDDLERVMKESGRIWPVPKVKGGKPTDVIVKRSGDQAMYMDEIIKRAQNIPTDKRIDNMLKVTNDARKMALDMRMIDGHEAGDPDGSKIHEVQQQIERIYKTWEADKGAQLVFIDLSTPKLTKTQRKAQTARAVSAEDAVEAELSMDEILAGQVEFSFYDALRERLVKAGIPDAEIAYIHDANTDAQKQKLFDKVRRGDVRIMMGSTPKMGAGMNVQDRLVGLHHVDAPWRPSDLEQREGRIVRQGNKLYQRDPEGFEIELLRYATEQTYDARMWQTLEGKARFIGQLRKGEVGLRQVEDIAGQAASYADLKAAATGNPLILEQVKLTSEVNKLEQMKRTYDRSLYRMQDTVASLVHYQKAAGKRMDRISADIKRRDKNTPLPPKKGQKPTINLVIDDKTITNKEEGGKRLAVKIVEAAKHNAGRITPIGTYRGFDLSTKRYQNRVGLIIDMDFQSEEATWTEQDKVSGSGTLQRLDNIINRIDESVAHIEERKREEAEELTNAQAELKKPFKQAKELETVQAQFKYVMAEFERMKDHNYEAQSVEDVLAGKIGKTLKPKPDEDQPGDIKLSKVSDRPKSHKGMTKKAVSDVVENFIKDYDDQLDIEFRVYQTREGAMGKEAAALLTDQHLIQGIYYARSRVIALIADDIRSQKEAISALRHELVAHHGLNLFTPDGKAAILKAVAESRNVNSLKRFWTAIDRDYPELSETDKAEEVIAYIAEQPQSQFLQVWNKIVNAIIRAMRAIRLIPHKISKSEIMELVETMNEGLKHGARQRTYPRPQDKKRPEVPQFAKKPTGSEDVDQKQAQFNDDMNAGQPIDKAFRKLFEVAGAPRVSKKIYERAEHYLTEAQLPQTRDDGVMNWMNGIINTARAGLLDRYGLPEDYIQREFIQEADKRKIELQAMDLLTMLDKRGVSDISEAQVLQAILTGEKIPTDEWAKVAAPVRAAIDELGQEAVDLGLISREAYERNKGTYLHRVYRGHEAEKTKLGKWVSNQAASRRKKFRGDELKGRGMQSKVTMEQLLKNSPPTWWGRKLKKTEADKQLRNQEFYILDLEQAIGQGTEELIEGGKQRKARTVKRVYWPADTAIPQRFGAYNNKGKWLVRDIQGNNIILWRDFTKKERENMGEILDARYTIAKTFMLMAHDLSTGRFFKDIAANEAWATKTEPPHWENPKGAMSTYSTAEWVKVPTTNIAGTQVKKWGALADMYVRAEIWRDLVELDRMQTPSFWQKILTQWKLNKTARNPVVHMNNIMSNMIFMDMADIRWRDLKRGAISYFTKDDDYKEALQNGAFGASYIEHEIKQEILDPILKELLQQDAALERGAVENWLNAREWGAKMSVLGKITDTVWRKAWDLDRRAVNIYQMEDEIFRMATYMRRLQYGDPPEIAARMARDQFLNYNIRAPWVNVARRSFLPFIAYTYRAVPVIAKSISERPWKIAKYATLAYIMNAMGYMLSDGDEDEERRALSERVQGRTWLGTPRLIRMPWSDDNGSPVFLDIRRWIPAGDVFDMNQNQMPLPAWIQFGGPLMLAGEFALNKQAFTGKEIVNDKTDTPLDKTTKYSGWFWRSWMPAHPLIPGSWYWNKIQTAATGGRDPLGRDYDLPMAALSSLGIKLAPHDVELGFMYHSRAFNSIGSELNFQANQLAKDRKRGLINAAEYEKQIQRIQRKQKRLQERAAETFGQ